MALQPEPGDDSQERILTGGAYSSERERHDRADRKWLVGNWGQRSGIRDQDGNSTLDL
jgi:hypothetical protein